jgi:hypothetical protein
MEKFAALLLVVAVLAGTCASGADAQFNITNLCNRTISVSTGATNVSVEAGTTVNITVPPALFFNGPVNISIPATGVPLTIPVSARIVSFVTSLFGVKNVAISCSGSCVSLAATFTVFTQITVPLGTFCLPSLAPPPSVQPYCAVATAALGACP